MSRFNTPTSSYRPAWTITGIVAAVVGIFVLATLWQGAFRIDIGEQGVVKRFGNISRVVGPGLHFKIPYVDNVEEIEVRERAYSMDLKAASFDPMEIPVTVTVNWMVKIPHVAALYTQYGDLSQFENRIIKPRLPDAVKGVVSSYAVNDLLLKRAEFRDSAMQRFKAQMPDMVEITGFSVENVGFPPEYTEQIKEKQVEREKAETEKYKLERQDTASKQVTQSANAQSNANRLLADAEAYKITAQGAAEAKAVELVGKALSANPLFVEYKKAEKWSGQFPATFMGGDQAANTLWSLPGKTTK